MAIKDIWQKITNITTIIVLAVSVVGLGFIFVYQKKILNNQNTIDQSLLDQKKFADGIVRSMTKYASKEDIEKMAASNNLSLKEIKSDLKSLNGNITAIQQVEANTPGGAGSNISSTYTVDPKDGSLHISDPKIDCGKNNIKCSDIDLNKTHYLVLEEPINSKQSIPFGSVNFSPWLSKPWGYEILPRKYFTQTVIGTDRNHRLYLYNKMGISVKNKNYYLDISKSEMLQQFPESEFSFFNPRFYLGVQTGLDIANKSVELAPTINFNMINYGKYVDKPEWMFLTLGMGYGITGQSLYFTASPVDYNLGRLTKFLTNTYIGPQVGLDMKKNFSFGLSLKVGL